MSKISQKRRRSKKRGISFSLSSADFRNLRKTKKCVVTEIRFQGDDNSPLSRTIDRIDSSKGYEPNNVIPVLGVVNRLKNQLFEQVNPAFSGIEHEQRAIILRKMLDYYFPVNKTEILEKARRTVRVKSIGERIEEAKKEAEKLTALTGNRYYVFENGREVWLSSERGRKELHTDRTPIFFTGKA